MVAVVICRRGISFLELLVSQSSEMVRIYDKAANLRGVQKVVAVFEVKTARLAWLQIVIAGYDAHVNISMQRSLSF